MMRLYEDILDDLDSIGKKNPTETLIEDSAKENFDYILYIGHQIKHNYKKELQIQEIENDYKRPLQKLKEKMDVYLDSYWTDDIIYYQEQVDAQHYIGGQMLPEEERPRLELNLGGLAGYRIYFNFDGNVMHMLQFFYACANDFHVWGSHSMARIYTKDGRQVGYKTTYPISFFKRYGYATFLKSSESIECLADSMLQWFWHDNRVMNIRRKEYHKLYIIDKIKKFVKHSQKELGNH